MQTETWQQLAERIDKETSQKRILGSSFGWIVNEVLAWRELQREALSNERSASKGEVMSSDDDLYAQNEDLMYAFGCAISETINADALLKLVNFDDDNYADTDEMRIYEKARNQSTRDVVHLVDVLADEIADRIAKKMRR